MLLKRGSFKMLPEGDYELKKFIWDFETIAGGRLVFLLDYWPSCKGAMLLLTDCLSLVNSFLENKPSYYFVNVDSSGSKTDFW